MRPYRNMLAPSGRILAQRLNQLCSTLDSLGSRLRTAVSQALGETVGMVVRDAVNNTLKRIVGLLPHHDPPLARSRSWQDDEDQDIWPDHGWDDDEDLEPCEKAPINDNRPHRIALSLSAGLSAAAWWLQRWSGKMSLTSTAIVVMIASFTVYSAPTLATAGLRVISSAGQIDFLRNAAQVVASA